MNGSIENVCRLSQGSASCHLVKYCSHCTHLFALVAGSTSKTDTTDDSDYDAECQQDDNGQEQAEVRVPDRSFRLRDRLLVNRFSSRRLRFENDWKTHLQFDT